jgi:hypothetical protein
VIPDLQATSQPFLTNQTEVVEAQAAGSNLIGAGKPPFLSFIFYNLFTC